MNDGSIVLMMSHNGHWPFAPTTVVRTIKKTDTQEYQVHMTCDGIVEIVTRTQNISDAYAKHAFLSATNGLKRKK